MLELITTTPVILYVAMGVASIMWAMVATTVVKAVRRSRRAV